MKKITLLLATLSLSFLAHAEIQPPPTADDSTQTQSVDKQQTTDDNQNKSDDTNAPSSSPINPSMAPAAPNDQPGP